MGLRLSNKDIIYYGAIAWIINGLVWVILFFILKWLGMDTAWNVVITTAITWLGAIKITRPVMAQIIMEDKLGMK